MVWWEYGAVTSILQTDFNSQRDPKQKKLLGGFKYVCFQHDICDDPQLLSHFCSCGSASTQFSSQDPDDVTDGALHQPHLKKLIVVRAWRVIPNFSGYVLYYLHIYICIII